MSGVPSAASEVQPENWKYSRIGGWLVLVAIGLCLSLLLHTGFIFTGLLTFLTSRTWPILTTPGASSYHPLWAPLIIFEWMMNSFCITIEAMLLDLLFKRLRFFPKAMIAYLFIAFALVSVDYVLSRKIPFLAMQNDSAKRISFVRTGVVCAIWVPYFLRSKRVKGTFVN